MLVRMLTDRASLQSQQRRGEVYDLEAKEALALVRAGQAEQVEAEVATVGAPENAMQQHHPVLNSNRHRNRHR